MSLGMLKTESVAGRLRAGLTKSSDVKWMDKFLGKGKWEKAVKEGTFGPDMLERAAAEFVRDVQGHYNFRGQPGWALSGPVAPFVSLTKWNLEKANNFTKHVLNPMRHGDFAPFLKMAGMAVVVGSGIETIRQMITDRKPQHATWGEIMDAGGAGLPYRLLANMTYSGFAGVFTDILKQGYEVSHGKLPQGFRSPLVSAISGFMDRGGQFAYALNAGENPIEALGRLPVVLAKDNIQMARALIRFVDEEEADMITRSNRARDVRIFEELAGMPNRPMTRNRDNPFLNPLKREYQNATEPADILRLAPQLTTLARERAMESGLPPAMQFEQFRANLRNLSTQSQDPTPKGPELQEYLRWVTRTQGPEAARQVLERYYQKQALDSAKRGLIPRL